MKEVPMPSAEPSIQCVSKPTAAEPPAPAAPSAPATKTPPAKNNDDTKKMKAEKKGKHTFETISMTFPFRTVQFNLFAYRESFLYSGRHQEKKNLSL